ncbi:MAG TPA: hypothetical protein VE860_22640, partial [Chthoniobacterales bacterium]|nr:hypothetical protein [Chthoniobacterales bacterium]
SRPPGHYGESKSSVTFPYADTFPPAFIATLWAAASWLFFRVARSLRIDLDMLVARALKNSQLTSGNIPAISGTGH